MTTPKTIRATEPRELLALIPFQLGFHPTESVVLVSLRPPRRRVGMMARADVVDAQRETLRQQVALDVWTTYQSLITATQSIRTAGDLLTSALQSERVALGRYKAGVGTILDVLNAQSALAAARVQRIQAALDWAVSRAALARAVGTLDHRLLNLSAELPIP